MAPRRPGSLRVIKPTSKARLTNQKTTGKGKTRATEDTGDNDKGNDQHDSDINDNEVADPRKSRKKRHRATDSGASEEMTGIVRKKGRRGSMRKQQDKAVEHIDDDDEEESEDTEVVEVVGDDDDEDVEEEVSKFRKRHVRQLTCLSTTGSQSIPCRGYSQYRRFQKRFDA